MTIKGGTSQACAACKYQRRRCAKDCPLSPHFPADQPKMFQNAHRLYGVSNIMKIRKQVHPEQQNEAMRSIIYESNMRAKFPPSRSSVTSEHISHFARTNANIESLPPPHYTMSSSQLQLGMPSNNDASAALTIYQHQYQYASAGGAAAAMSFVANEYLANGLSAVYIDDNDMVKPLRVQNPYYSDNNVDQLMAVQSNLVSPQTFPIHQEMDVPHDYDDIPFDTIADDRQSYIESKEACESSAESSFKGTTQSIEHVSQNDLKSAAACFSLTSVK
ncbi:LOB domain-containing protein 27-like [Prunus yedoensis var. nudiflora]|uniref:LOB domain-containing protein 27-like n=1 Tax=Prunus yedoensis var. nudiflora TaxID=2094558 RepID=A0A314YE20_PRUYE|nr:LOB domain-containing protein 27-like [Prunus yedoensis var. nudiflora]